MDTITYKIEDQSKLVKHILNFIFNIIGIRAEEIGSDKECNNLDIYYGNKESVKKCNIVIKKNERDIIWNELLSRKISFKEIESTVPFDIINAIKVFITDEVNKNALEGAYDNHDRLIFDQSFQARNNIAQIPIINLYIMFFKSLIQKKFFIKSISLWPKGKKCAIGLSHDVDNPDKYSILNAPFLTRNMNFKDNLFLYLIKIKKLIKSISDKNPNEFWLFNEIMNFEEKLGFKSTFFFAAMNKFGKWGSNLDVPYDINDSKFRKVFDEIKNRGFEIGLHVGYNTYLDINRLLFEKQILIRFSEFDIKGLRHHFWHTGRNPVQTFKMHEEAGFEYDSSIAFNDDIGFRRSIALPYYPWNDIDNKPFKVIQLPVFCMDGNLFYRSIKVEYAIKKLKKFIKEIKKYNGLGVIDWHVRTSYPKSSEFFDWGKSYVRILEYLSTDKEIWVTNLGKISSWIKKRENTLSSNIK